MKKFALPLSLLLLCVLLSGCSGAPKEEAASLSCAELADKIYAAAEFRELTDMTEKYFEKYLLIEAASLDDWVMRRDATRATPEMILIVTVKEGQDQKAVRQAFQDFRDEQLLQYRDYQPTQTFKLENAQVREKGRMVALIVSPDREKTDAALGDGWK